MSMDGSNNSVLFNYSTVTSPSALTMDYDTQTLYWYDAFTHTIAKSDMFGSTRNQSHRVLQQINAADHHTDYLEYFDSNVYWGNLFNDTIYSLGVGAPQRSVRFVVRVPGGDPRAIHAVDLKRQPAGQSMCDCVVIKLNECCI